MVAVNQIERVLDDHDDLWADFLLTYGEGVELLAGGDRYGVPILDNGFTIIRDFGDDESMTVVDSFEEAVDETEEALTKGEVTKVEIFDFQGELQLLVEPVHHVRWMV